MPNLVTRAVRKIVRTINPPNFAAIRTAADVRRLQGNSGFDPNNITGWMSGGEQELLFLLATASTGDILEIGPWLGRSTEALARGMKASGRWKRKFITCELAPTMEFYREQEDGRIGFYYPPESTVSLGSMTPEAFDREKRPWLDREGGFIPVLKENLAKSGVESLVTVVVDNFHNLPDDGRFSLIFADVTHSVEEIELHGADLKRLLAPGGVIACHDTNAANEAALRKLFSFKETARADSLFAGWT